MSNSCFMRYEPLLGNAIRDLKEEHQASRVQKTVRL